MGQTALARGIIEYVNSGSGCGFIATEETVKEVLFRRDDVVGPVPEVGEEVTFEIAQSKDGPRAMNVQHV